MRFFIKSFYSDICTLNIHTENETYCKFLEKALESPLDS